MDRQELEQLLDATVSSAGFSLFDYQPAVGNKGVLRIFVFRKNRESPLPALDDCSAIARTLLDHPLVDQFIPGDSTLEVSTPGVNRPLKTFEHFIGAVGERVRIKWRPAGLELCGSRSEGNALEDTNSKSAPASQVELGVVSEVLEATDSLSDATVLNSETGLNSESASQRSQANPAGPVIVLRREASSKKGKKQRKNDSSRNASEVLQSEVPDAIARIPLNSIVEAHVDFAFD